jgi:PKD repeat protein
LVDDVSIYTWVWSEGANGGNNLLQLGGSNFYGWTGKGVGKYYIDEYKVKQTCGAIPSVEDLVAVEGGSCNEVELDWSYSGCSEFNNFNIYRNNNLIGTSVTEGFSDNSLADGVYTYVVTPVCGGTEGPASNAAEITISCNQSIPPPNNLSATWDNTSVINLAWDLPEGNGSDYQICDDDNTSSIGLTNGGEFYCAAQFEPDEDRLGYQIDDVSFFWNATSAPDASFTIMIWEGENSDLTELVSQEVTAATPDDWTTVVLNDPLMINPFKKLWIGYKVTQPTPATYPAGNDEGPALDGGDMISSDGVSFYVLHELAPSIDANWNIKASVSFGGSFNVYYHYESNPYSLLGNTSSDFFSHTYSDGGGTYTYKVKTLINGEESIPSNEASAVVNFLTDNDIGITAITSPVSSFGLGSNENVSVLVKNFGTLAQTGFDVSFSVNGGTEVIETFPSTLNPGESENYTFSTTVDLSSIGNYEFTACTQLANDENPNNDCIDAIIVNQDTIVSEKYIGKAGNIYYALGEEQQCLTYDPASNLLQMIHRADPSTYSDANSNNGSIVSSQSTNHGVSWNYKMLWPFDGIHNTRYPQGYIFNVDNNPDPEEVIIGTMGPSHNNGTWADNFFVSAKNDENLTGLYASFVNMNCTYNLASRGSAVTDDGYVYGLSTCEEVSGGSQITFNLDIYRGEKVDYHIDFEFDPVGSIDVLDVTTYYWGKVGMAWSQDGSIGYAFVTGLLNTFAGNSSYNPIVWKSTDHGETWTLLIDGMNMVNFPGLEDVLVLSDDGYYAPLFKGGIAGTVDANGNLQFFGECVSAKSLNVNECYIPSDNETDNRLLNVTISPTNGIIDFHLVTLFQSTDVDDYQSDYAYGGEIGWNHRIQTTRSEDGQFYFVTYGDTENASYYDGENAHPDLYIWGSHCDITNEAFASKMTDNGYYWFHYVSDIAIPLGGSTFQIPVSKTVTQLEMLTNSDIDPVTIEYVDGLCYTVPYSTDPPEITQQPVSVDVCSGEDVSIQILTENATTFQWYKNGSIMNGQTSNTITFSPAQVDNSGEYYCEVSNPFGSLVSDVATLSVFETPTPSILGNLAFCEGDVSTLDAGAGYVSYYWNTGATTQTITVVTGGTYSVEVTNDNGCQGTDEVEVVVTPIPPTPIISTNNTELCEGESAILLVNNPQANVTYYWSNGTSGTPITVSDAGIYSCYGIQNTCQSDNSNEIEIQVQAPEADFTSDITTGFTPLDIQFMDASTGEIISWNWDFGDGGTSDLQNPIYTYVTPGLYTVSLEVETSFGCTDTKTLYDFVDALVSVDENPSASIDIFPNPSDGLLHINTDDGVVIQEIRILNILGETVYFDSYDTYGHSVQNEIDLTHLDSGAYFVILKSADLKVMKKLILK